jgi:hypothetical protein
MVFLLVLTSYAKVVERVKTILNWMEPSDEVRLEEIYDVGLEPRSHLKIVPTMSKLDKGHTRRFLGLIIIKHA